MSHNKFKIEVEYGGLILEYDVTFDIIFDFDGNMLFFAAGETKFPKSGPVLSVGGQSTLKECIENLVEQIKKDLKENHS